MLNLNVCQPLPREMLDLELRKLSAEQEPNTGTLPKWVADALCDTCDGVLTPGLNCRVRVRHRSLGSPSVKKAQSAPSAKGIVKCRNEVVTTCLLCGGANIGSGTERRAHHKKRNRGGLDAANAPDVTETPIARRSRTAKNFRGNYIPLGGESSLPASASLVPPGSSVGTPATETAVRKRKRPKKSPQPRQASTPSISNKNVGNDFSFSDRGKIPDRKVAIGLGQHTANKVHSANNVANPSTDGQALRMPARADAGVDSSPAAGGAAAEAVQGPSLLEKIRKDAKKKRRQEAAMSAAASGDKR